ncbi:MAG TPA: hypothetical protein VFE55_11535 [Acidimicrobiia bacterium]|nr:hypothetical protein [Acidimicrobiia bacterium]
MRIRSLVTTGALAAALVAGVAAPALAHEEIAPKTFPTGQPTFFTLTAANETDNPLTKVVLHAPPAGPTLGETTRAPAGWSAARTPTAITWTGGSVKPDTFDTWGFEIDGADQPGTVPFKVDLVFTHPNGDIETEGGIEVDVTATAPGATAGATGGAGPASSTTVTTAAAPTTAAAGGGKKDSGPATGLAIAALALSVVALITGGRALALAGRRRPGPAAGGGDGGGGAAGGAAQDW